MAPRKQKAKTRARQPAESGEEFQLSDVQSDGDISVNDPSLSSPSLRDPTSNLSGLNWGSSVNPEIAAQSDKSTAADVHYFFKMIEGRQICVVCK